MSTSMYGSQQFVNHFFQTFSRRCGETVCQDERVASNSIGINVMPYGKDNFVTVHLSGDQTIELFLWPLLRKERRADYHHPEARMR